MYLLLLLVIGVVVLFVVDLENVYGKMKCYFFCVYRFVFLVIIFVNVMNEKIGLWI